MGLFKRKRPPTPEELLAEGRRDAAAAQSPGEGAAAGRSAPAEFRLRVEDVFAITGRGVVATGRVAAGSVAIGDEVRLWCGDRHVNTLTVSALESFRRTRTDASAGDNVGMLFKGIGRDDISAGDVLTG